MIDSMTKMIESMIKMVEPMIQMIESMISDGRVNDSDDESIILIIAL